MTSIASIVAGIALLGGAVTVARLAKRKIDAVKNAVQSQGGPPGRKNTLLDYEQDPITGVFRPKDR